VRADLMQAHEQENQCVRNARKQQPTVKCAERDNRCDGERIFQKPVAAVMGLNRHRHP
jgi:hypothetical protein